jgi:hypothetical protein
MTWRWLGGEEGPDESRVEIDLIASLYLLRADSRLILVF